MTTGVVTRSLWCLVLRGVLGACVLFTCHLPVLLAATMIYRALQRPDLAWAFVSVAIALLLGLSRWRSFYLMHIRSQTLGDWLLDGRGRCPLSRRPK